MDRENDIVRAARTLGIAATFRLAPTYVICGQHCHTRDKALRLCKRAMCQKCKNYVFDEDRPGKALTLDDVDPTEDGWDEYRLDRYERWLAGCKAGRRPDLRKYEDEPPDSRPGGWWGTVSFPCPGYEARPLEADSCPTITHPVEASDGKA